MARPKPKTRLLIDMRINPTPERLAKGDVANWTPRGETNPQKQVHRVMPDPNPLAELLSRGTIDHAEYSAGHDFGRLYIRALGQGGEVNMEFIDCRSGSGDAVDRLDAASRFRAMCRELGNTDHDRLNRTRVLIEVAGKRRSLREAYPGSRARQVASNQMVIGLQRLVRYAELAAAS